MIIIKLIFRHLVHHKISQVHSNCGCLCNKFNLLCMRDIWIIRSWINPWHLKLWCYWISFYSKSKFFNNYINNMLYKIQWREVISQPCRSVFKSRKPSSRSRTCKIKSQYSKQRIWSNNSNIQLLHRRHRNIINLPCTILCQLCKTVSVIWRWTKSLRWYVSVHINNVYKRYEILIIKL